MSPRTRVARAAWFVVLGWLAAACASEGAATGTILAGPIAETTPTAIVTTAPAAVQEPAATPTALAIAPTSSTAVPTTAPTSEVRAGTTATAAATPAGSAPPAAATAVPTVAVAGSQTVLAANGGEVYTLNCARCHAENGLGTAQYGATLIGVGSLYSSQGMIAELTTGHPVTFGFADRLSADEIASVVAYVKATFP